MNGKKQAGARPRDGTFHFINVLRFVSAGWVVLAHLGAPPLDTLCITAGLGQYTLLVRKALIAPFSGVAAVMVFFVVSGFCIHFPFVNGKRHHARSFLAQRLTRIGLPLAAAVMLHQVFGTVPWFKNIVWSIYCEIIYYLGYPLLRPLIAGIGAGRLVTLTFVVSWLFCLLPEDGYGHIIAYGDGWTWLVCLPAWLCGCLLAEWIAGKLPVPNAVARATAWITEHQWLVGTRVAVWALSSVLLVLGMEEMVPFKYSVPAFALVVMVWLFAELKRPCAESWMSSAGFAGYSIYLCHPAANLIKQDHFPALHPLLFWCVRIAMVAAVCALFYFVIEKPSHQLARKLGRMAG